MFRVRAALKIDPKVDHLTTGVDAPFPTLFRSLCCCRPALSIIVPAKAGTIRRGLVMEHDGRNLSIGCGYSSLEFTNGVQHLLQGVLSWDAVTSNCH